MTLLVEKESFTLKIVQQTSMSAIQRDLIFDVGMNDGEDTGYYLSRGFRVVGIYADPSMIEVVKSTFPEEVKNSRLILLNCAVSSENDEEVQFYLNEDPHWNSLDQSLTERGVAGSGGLIMVKTKMLPAIMQEFGIPYYCKIDVQGFDAVLLRILLPSEERPAFISVEAECDPKTEEQALETLERLHDLDYEKFKLVDQASLRVLTPSKRIYGEPGGSFRSTDPLMRKIYTHLRPKTKFYGLSSSGPISRLREEWRLNFHRRFLSMKLRYSFAVGSSGPFNDDLGSEWLDYRTAKEMAIRHRREYFESISSGWNYPSKGFWCDWHAKLN